MSGPRGARRFHAPGKLMLAGEYAVLAPGGEALALAVDGCGVEVLATLADPAGDWRVAREDGGGALSFARAALDEARAVFDADRALPPHRLLTRTVLPAADADGDKQGVGSSASVTVAVVAAVAALAARRLDGEVDRAAVFAAAFRAHRAAQGGRGSGYDVATAVFGGLICFRSADAAEDGALPAVRRLGWPAGLVALRGYSGRGASTGAFLGKLAALRSADGAGLDAELGRLGGANRALLEALERGDRPAVASAVGGCHGALAAWDAAHELGIVTPAIAELIALAGQAGAAAKVSGAGGGDSVIALAPGDEAARATLARWRAAGFAAAEVAIDPRGVRELPSADDRL